MPEAAETPQEARSELAFAVDINGHEVRVVVNYPDGEGLSALQTIHQLNKRSNQLFYQLHQDGDRSIRAKMREQGIEYDDPDEDEDDWDDDDLDD